MDRHRRPLRPESLVRGSAASDPRSSALADRVEDTTSALRAVGAVRLVAHRGSGGRWPSTSRCSPPLTRSPRRACTQPRRVAGLRTRRSTPRSQSACTSPQCSSAQASSTSSTTGSTSCRSHIAIWCPHRWSPRSTGSRPIGSFLFTSVMTARSAYVSISDADRHPDLHYAATIHHGIEIDDSPSIRIPASICCSSDESTPTRAPPTRSKSPADAAVGSTSPESSRTRSTLTTRSHRTSTATGCATSGPSTPLRVPRCWGRARATPPHRLRRTVRIQRRRGDGLWHAGHRQLERLDGRADRHGVTGFLVDDIDSAVAAVTAAGLLDRPAIAARRRRALYGFRHGRQIREGVPRRD